MIGCSYFFSVYCGDLPNFLKNLENEYFSGMCCISGEPLEKLYEYAPDVLDGGELNALAGGVGLYNAGADAGHLDTGIVLYKETCLEHEVHGHHTRTPA